MSNPCSHSYLTSTLRTILRPVGVPTWTGGRRFFLVRVRRTHQHNNTGGESSVAGTRALYHCFHQPKQVVKDSRYTRMIPDLSDLIAGNRRRGRPICLLVAITQRYTRHLYQNGPLGRHGPYTNRPAASSRLQRTSRQGYGRSWRISGKPPSARSPSLATGPICVG